MELVVTSWACVALQANNATTRNNPIFAILVRISRDIICLLFDRKRERAERTHDFGLNCHSRSPIGSVKNDGCGVPESIRHSIQKSACKLQCLALANSTSSTLRTTV